MRAFVIGAGISLGLSIGFVAMAPSPPNVALLVCAAALQLGGLQSLLNRTRQP